MMHLNAELKRANVGNSSSDFDKILKLKSMLLAAKEKS
jgi:hypothetical protein